jgi:hypothetical protein
MKKIRVINSRWFKTAEFSDIKMLGIKHLHIPADKFLSRQNENFKRVLVRMVYEKQFEYGLEFEIQEISNPFGIPKRKRAATNILSGEYQVLNVRLRAPKDDIRWEMVKVLKGNTTFEAASAEFASQYGSNIKFKSTGKLEFDFKGFMAWAEKCGWIITV